MLNRLLYWTILILVIAVFHWNCSNRSTSGRDAKGDLVMLLLSASNENKLTDAQKACYVTVKTLNECVAEGYGFNTGTMCSPVAVGTTEASKYDGLTACARTYIAKTSCDLNQNKFANAKSAWSSSSYLTAGVGGTTSFSADCSLFSDQVKYNE